MIFRKVIDEKLMAKEISNNTGIELEIVLKILDEEFKYLDKNKLIKRRNLKWLKQS